MILVYKTSLIVPNQSLNRNLNILRIMSFRTYIYNNKMLLLNATCLYSVIVEIKIKVVWFIRDWRRVAVGDLNTFCIKQSHFDVH